MSRSAALKGWATRRANQERAALAFARRSAAALKGWATRREVEAREAARIGRARELAEGRPWSTARPRKKSERLQVQVGFVFQENFTRADRKRMKIEALEDFFRTGGNGQGVPGVRVVMRWRNPDNANPLHANWKTSDDPGQSLSGVYSTLHGGSNGRGALRGILKTLQEKKAGEYGYF